MFCKAFFLLLRCGAVDGVQKPGEYYSGEGAAAAAGAGCEVATDKDGVHVLQQHDGVGRRVAQVHREVVVGHFLSNDGLQRIWRGYRYGLRLGGISASYLPTTVRSTIARWYATDRTERLWNSSRPLEMVCSSHPTAVSSSDTSVRERRGNRSRSGFLRHRTTGQLLERSPPGTVVGY